MRLARASTKNGVSLSAPSQPKSGLQSLPSTLRIANTRAISSCSKASGVFSSNCRYPASSPELYFHRASLRDSCPVVTLFNARELTPQGIALMLLLRNNRRPRRLHAEVRRIRRLRDVGISATFSLLPVRSDYFFTPQCGGMTYSLWGSRALIDEGSVSC